MIFKRSQNRKKSTKKFARRVHILFVVMVGLGSILSAAVKETDFCGGNCPLQNGNLFPKGDFSTGKSRFSESFLRSVTVRVVNGHPRGGNPNASFVSVEKGSGVCLENNRQEMFVLTAAHIFQDGVGVVLIQTLHGKQTRARIVLIDPFWDIALAALDERLETNVIQISDRTPKVGERSFIAGFGSDDRFKITFGKVVGYSMTSRQSNYETLRTTGAVRQGDSGGPVVDDDNRLIGVVWGTDGASSYATWNGRIKKILAAENHLAFEGMVPKEEKERNIPRHEEFAEPDEDEEEEKKTAPIQNEETEHKIESPRKELEDLKETIKPEKAESPPSSTEIIKSLADSTFLQILSLSGVSVPPLFFILLSLMKWRVKKKAAKAMARQVKKKASSIIDQNNEYAIELNDLYDLNGRNSVADATCGRLYDLELEGAEKSSDPAIASYAQMIRRKIKDELVRIHSKTSVPGS